MIDIELAMALAPELSPCRRIVRGRFARTKSGQGVTQVFTQMNANQPSKPGQTQKPHPQPNPAGVPGVKPSPTKPTPGMQPKPAGK